MKRNSRNGVASIAKPMYVLAIIDGIEKGVVHNNRLFSADLFPVFSKLCKNREIDKIPFFYYPYCYLQNDGFYNFHWKGNPTRITSPSAKFIREHIDYAYLDNALWDLLQDAEIRQEYKELIEKYYLT